MKMSWKILFMSFLSPLRNTLRHYHNRMCYLGVVMPLGKSLMQCNIPSIFASLPVNCKFISYISACLFSCHPGNQTLRTLVRAHKPLFLQQRKTEKREVARKIVNDFQHKLGGRFLIEDPNNKAHNGSMKNDKEGMYKKIWIAVETEKGECVWSYSLGIVHLSSILEYFYFVWSFAHTHRIAIQYFTP